MSHDLRTRGIVLRRTNYGESDRIINLITPEGKISALAKASRKEKSKLAGGIELFTVSDIVVHQSRSTGLAILTSSRMMKFYGKILGDFTRLELAALFLKKVNYYAENNDSAEYFELLNQGLEGLNDGIEIELTQAWFLMNLIRINGEEINLIRDVEGNELQEGQRYNWDTSEKALRKTVYGKIDSATIKLARLMLRSKLEVMTKIKDGAEILPNLEPIIRCFEE